MTNISCVIGDPFFFLLAEKIIRKKYNIIKSNTIKIMDPIDKSLLLDINIPALFNIDYKLCILRNIPISLINTICGKSDTNDKIIFLIEIEGIDYDKRSKILKELDKNGDIKKIGYATKKNKLLKIAIQQISDNFNINIEDSVCNFIQNNYSLTEKDNAYNLLEIFNDIQKAFSFSNYTIVTPKILSQVMSYQYDRNIIDILNGIKNKDKKLVFKLIDDNLYNMQDLMKIIYLIISELNIISKIKTIQSNKYQEIADKINKKVIKYEHMDCDREQNKEIHPYRVKKIMENRNGFFFRNHEEVLFLIDNMFNNINSIYYSNPKIPLYRLCFKLFQMR